MEKLVRLIRRALHLPLRSQDKYLHFEEVITDSVYSTLVALYGRHADIDWNHDSLSHREIIYMAFVPNHRRRIVVGFHWHVGEGKWKTRIRKP